MSLPHSCVCSALLSHVTAQQQKTAEEEKEKSLHGDVRAAVFAQTCLLFDETGATHGIQKEAKLLIPSFRINMISILLLALVFWIDSPTPSNLT